MSANFKEEIYLFKCACYNSKMLQSYKLALANESLSRDELEDLNWRKRKDLISYAYSNIPFYRKSFDDAGIHPDIIRTPDDFQKIPILHKSNVRKNFELLKAPHLKSWDFRISTTGGSSGEPLTVLHDTRYPHDVLGWRMLKWWGCGLGQNGGYVWRFIRPNRLERTFFDLLWWPTRRVRLDATQMDRNTITKFVSQFNRLKPPLLQGYVGAIDEVARCIQDLGVTVHSPEAVWVTASVMLRSQRERIEQVFGAPVYDQYGSGEVAWIAAECDQHAGLHVFSDARSIEIVDSNGNACSAGEVGRVLVTDLQNYSFPIIRYENGDLSSFSGRSCTCGRNFPLISQIIGRVTDHVYLPNGTVISGDYLTTIFDACPKAVDNFRIHQHEDFSVDLIVSPNTSWPNHQADISQVLDGLKMKTNGLIQVRLKFDENIASDGGKNRFVVSDLKPR